MESPHVRRPSIREGRSKRMVIALGACAMTLSLAARADAQTLDTQRSPAVHPNHPRRARTVRPDSAKEITRDYANEVENAALIGDQGDIAFLETRVRDLSAKVRELSELLQQKREAAEPLRFVPKPKRVTLLERHRPVVLPKTYGEALPMLVRERVRAVMAAFSDDSQREHLAFDPDQAEVRRLLEPVDEELATTGTPAETTHAHLRALVYVTLLEARANIDGPVPLPAMYKMLRDLHVDRAALSEHLRRSFLLDNPAAGSDLHSILAATATTYPDPPSMRDFLKWIAAGVGTDLKEELFNKSAYPYRGDATGQFDAAAENATSDNGDVLKLQVELQRMLVEAKALRSMNRVDHETDGEWQHRLLHAERELDRLLRFADSEREAVMTLARRVPIERGPNGMSVPINSISIEPAEEVASDGLATQH